MLGGRRFSLGCSHLGRRWHQITWIVSDAEKDFVRAAAVAPDNRRHHGQSLPSREQRRTVIADRTYEIEEPQVGSRDSRVAG
jgi:hypothetical protein